MTTWVAEDFANLPLPLLVKNVSTSLQEKKSQANEAVQNGQYEEATQLYSSILNSLKKLDEISLTPPTHDLVESKDDWLAVVASNLSFCYLKQHLYSLALSTSTLALVRVPTYTKALYRRARASIELGDLQSAAVDAQKLATITPQDAHASQLLREIREQAMAEQLSLVEESLPTTSFTALDDPESSSNVILSAFAVLRSWIVARGKLERLLKEDIVRRVVLFLSNVNAEVNVRRSAWSFCLLLVTDPEDVVEGNLDLSDVYRRRLHELSKPVKVSAVVATARSQLLQQIPWPKFLEIAKMQLRRNLTPLPANLVETQMTASQKETDIAASLLHVVQYLGSFEATESLEIISMGLSTVEATSVQRSGLHALGYIADLRRRCGNKVAALNVSQPLMKCLEGCLALAGVDELRAAAEVTTVTCFQLLADKDRSEKDAVDMLNVAGLLLDPYLLQASGYEPHNLLIGFHGLQWLWVADRECAQLYILNNQLLPTLVLATTQKDFQEMALQSCSADLLMLSMEFKDLRQQVLDCGGVDALLDLCNRFNHDKSLRAKIVGTLARLTIHSEEVRSQVFKRADFFALGEDLLRCTVVGDYSGGTGEICSASSQFYQNLLEILLFLSMHGEFKRELLSSDPRIVTEVIENRRKTQKGRENDCPSKERKVEDGEEEDSIILRHIPQLGKVASERGESAPMFTYTAIIYNLTRSREDKERVKRTGTMPMLESDELQQLRDIYERLPTHARPEKNAEFDRGDVETAKQMRKKLLDLGAARWLSQFVVRKPPPTIGLLTLAGLSLRYFASEASWRGSLVKQGGLAALLTVASALKMEVDDQRDIRQALAQIAIAVPPQLLPYEQMLDLVPHLLALLTDSYELYQYESALALTNLLGQFEEVRIRVVHGKGWEILRDVAVEENPLVRAAGIEGWCNLAMSSLITDRIAEGQYEFDLKILFAFLFETENERAQQAAAGCLATLASDLRVALRMTQIENFRNLAKAILTLQSLSAAVELRLVTCAVCILQALESTKPSDYEGETTGVVTLANRLLGDESAADSLAKCRSQAIESLREALKSRMSCMSDEASKVCRQYEVI